MLSKDGKMCIIKVGICLCCRKTEIVYYKSRDMPMLSKDGNCVL